jgi:hypothetical protein
MDPGYRSPLLDFFRRGEVAADVRLVAAQGTLVPHAQEQLALLVLLADDPDPEVARTVAATLDALPAEAIRLSLCRADATPEMRRFFAARGIEVAPGDIHPVTPDAAPAAEEEEEESSEAERKDISQLTVLERMKMAMKGTREQRAVLVRDSNKLVSAAVLSSPKVNEAEIETFTKMGNVSEDVLRIIGQNRSWTKNYGVILGLCRHPKTPPAIAMSFVQRLNEKDLKALAIDRNAKEGLRLLAKKMITKGKV